MIKTTQFEHDGRTFEVRAEAMNNEIKVRLFEGVKLASPVSYGLTIETAFDGQMSGYPLGLVDGIMDLLEHEVVANQIVLFPKSD